jgi:superoxide reductase
MLKTYVCKVCGHVAFNEAPVDCPVCRMAIENFENEPDAIKKPADPDNLTELEKKHIPVIETGRACNEASSGTCTDVYIKVGEMEHVMKSEHLIEFIDVYIDMKYISRMVFTAKKLYPAAHLHVNGDAGVISAISHCNVHGNWRSKVRLNES